MTIRNDLERNRWPTSSTATWDRSISKTLRHPTYRHEEVYRDAELAKIAVQQMNGERILTWDKTGPDEWFAEYEHASGERYGFLVVEDAISP